MSVVVPYIYSV